MKNEKEQKVDGSSFKITDVRSAECYTPEDGEPMVPAAGYRFLVVTASLSGDVKVAEMRLKYAQTGLEANWYKGPFDKNGQTDYVFSVLQSLTEEEAMRGWNMRVALQAGAHRYTRDYSLSGDR